MSSSWWTGLLTGLALGGCVVGLGIAGYRRGGNALDVRYVASQAGASQTGAADTPNSTEPRRPRPAFSSPRREEEWREADLFLQQHAPHYIRKVETLALSESRLRQLHSTMISRYQLLQRMKEHFPELYEVRVRQLELFDTLFATHQQYLAAGDGERERLRMEMKREVRELFDNSLKDRQTRIDRLHDMLGNLTSSVESDAKNQDKVVESHFQTVLAKGVDPSLLDGMIKDEPQDAAGGGERKLRKLLAPTTGPAAN